MINNKFNESYKCALSDIKGYTGLSELSLIEKVGLRNIVLEVLNFTPKRYVPDGVGKESAVMFLEQFYDYAPDNKTSGKLLQIRRNSIKERGVDVVAEYFKRKQDQMHLI